MLLLKYFFELCDVVDIRGLIILGPLLLLVLARAILLISDHLATTNSLSSIWMHYVVRGLCLGRSAIVGGLLGIPEGMRLEVIGVVDG